MKKNFSFFLLTMIVATNVHSDQNSTLGANFYTNYSYEGVSHFYPQSDQVIDLVTGNLNDAFNSVDIGYSSKVLAWRHSSDAQEGQIFKIFDDSSPNLDEMLGLTKIKIVPKESEEILIRLIDKTNSGMKFCLYANIYSPDSQTSAVTTCTDNKNYQIVGYIAKSGKKIISSLQVRNLELTSSSYGQFINSGSVYYTKYDNTINIADDYNSLINFPKNMSYEIVGENHIDFYLISTNNSFI